MIAIKTVRKFDPHCALGGDETRTVTGATKPAAQGQCRLGQLALQAGVI
jgi:hypothetical protein